MNKNRERRPHPLVELTKARFLEFLRDPSAIFWVFVFPILLTVVLGIAFKNQGPEKIEVGFLGPAAEELLERIDAQKPEGEKAQLKLTPMNPGQASAALKSGKIDLIVRAEFRAGGTPMITYQFDPTRPGARMARLAVDNLVQSTYGRIDTVQVIEEQVEEKVSRLIFLVMEVGFLVLFAYLVFSVRIQGGILTLALVALVGTAAFSGLALLIASRTASTETASGWMNLVQLPLWLLSGSFFAYSRFPEFLHPWIRLLPLTALNDAARAVMNDGSGISAITWELAVLAFWSLVSFAVALRIFKWH
ncbi:MAG: ABC transporter permease [Proteobacteria bacterium]|nr:ABC transporter permease [Pseudomonadota bacterium]